MAGTLPHTSTLSGTRGPCQIFPLRARGSSSWFVACGAENDGEAPPSDSFRMAWAAMSFPEEPRRSGRLRPGAGVGGVVELHRNRHPVAEGQGAVERLPVGQAVGREHRAEVLPEVLRPLLARQRRLEQQSFFLSPSALRIGSGGTTGRTSRRFGCASTAHSDWWWYVFVPSLWFFTQQPPQCIVGDEKCPVPSTDSR